MTTGPIPLTEERVREVFREYARLSSPSVLGTFEQHMDGVEVMKATPEQLMEATLKSLTSEPAVRLIELAAERQRAEAIAQLIGLLGVDEARVQATTLSTRAAAEAEALETRQWDYTLRDYTMLRAARVIGGETLPIQADEVDAVASAMDELCALDSFFGMTYRRAQEAGAHLRADPKAGAEPAAPRRRSPEARKWLARKRPRSELGANRFRTHAEAAAFVESLYAAGAADVRVPGDSIQEDVGFDHADALRVFLPENKPARDAILAIVNAESQRDGFDLEVDAGQKEVFLWWD